MKEEKEKKKRARKMGQMRREKRRVERTGERKDGRKGSLILLLLSLIFLFRPSFCPSLLCIRSSSLSPCLHATPLFALPIMWLRCFVLLGCCPGCVLFVLFLPFWPSLLLSCFFCHCVLAPFSRCVSRVCRLFLCMLSMVLSSSLKIFRPYLYPFAAIYQEG